MQNSMSEFAALIKEFCTDVLQLNAVIGIAVMIILFILEVRWTRSHPPRSRRKERAVALGHVVTARRVSYWDDGVTPDEKTTSWYHATYAYEVAEKQYQYKYLRALFLLCKSSSIILAAQAEHSAATKNEVRFLKFFFFCSRLRPA